MTQTNEAAFETVVPSGLEKLVARCSWSQQRGTKHTENSCTDTFYACASNITEEAKASN